jgi:hypothetical protein
MCELAHITGDLPRRAGLRAEILRPIAADFQTLGAKIGVFVALHTWGYAPLLYHHLHCIVAGGRLSADGTPVDHLGCRLSAPDVGFWHNPAAPATGQPVRLLGYFDLSLVFCVYSRPAGNSSVQSS